MKTLPSQRVPPKKWLGQHFLKDLNIAEKIAGTLQSPTPKIVEIGPGMGVLTNFLLKRRQPLTLIEIDSECVNFLKTHFAQAPVEIIHADALKMDFKTAFPETSLSIIGNYPYNISSQIVFKAIENRDKVVEFCGMFQREVAQRLCASPGGKDYGIISVLVQAYYDAEYLFTVPAEVFAPPPKVQSGVIRLVRASHYTIPDEALFTKIVKTAFNQRRKTLRNSLKSLQIDPRLTASALFDLRPEQLSVKQFVELTELVIGSLKT